MELTAPFINSISVSLIEINLYIGLLNVPACVIPFTRGSVCQPVSVPLAFNWSNCSCVKSLYVNGLPSFPGTPCIPCSPFKSASCSDVKSS